MWASKKTAKAKHQRDESHSHIANVALAAKPRTTGGHSCGCHCHIANVATAYATKANKNSETTAKGSRIEPNPLSKQCVNCNPFLPEMIKVRKKHTLFYK